MCTSKGKRGIRLGMDRLRRVFGPDVDVKVSGGPEGKDEVMIWVPTAGIDRLVEIRVVPKVGEELSDGCLEAMCHTAETAVIHSLLRPE